MVHKVSSRGRLFTAAIVPMALFLGSTSLLADIVNTYAYRGLSGEDLQAVLQEGGYRAELTEDSVGDPLIRTGLDGSNVSIWFYNCADGTCSNIRFSVGLDLSNGTTLKKINEYNTGYIIATASMDDENDPWLRMTHDVANGVTKENLLYVVRRYEAALNTFKEHFDFK